MATISILQKNKTAAISKMKRMIAATKNYAGSGTTLRTEHRRVISAYISTEQTGCDSFEYFIVVTSNYYSDPETLVRAYKTNFRKY